MSGKSGLNEELVYNSKAVACSSSRFCYFLAATTCSLLVFRRNLDRTSRFYSINVTSHEAVDLGEVSAECGDVVWAEPGKSVLFSRTINGLTNIWNYSLQDRSLTQITFGTGPDYLSDAGPRGKGIYYVNGKSSGFLTAYHVHSKESTNIVSKEATQPIISPDGKRVMYITLPASDRSRTLGVGHRWGQQSDNVAARPGRIAPVHWDLGTGQFLTCLFGKLGTSAGAKVYIVGADGSGLRQLPR